MSMEDYNKAYRLGQRAYLAAPKGKEYLPVLEDILDNNSVLADVNLGLEQIPTNLIVGTFADGRSKSFAPNFMPILEANSEFALKWSRLCDSHIKEGIHDAIKCYEYMHQYYVIEGNKRVSVLKYFESPEVAANVIRKVPKKTDTKENKIYYEYMDFHDKTRINYIYFTKEGSFDKLVELVGKKPEDKWSDDDLMELRAAYQYFNMAFEAKGGLKLGMTTGDALLVYLGIYDYDELKKQSQSEIKENLSKIWEEIKLNSKEESVELVMQPSNKEQSIIGKIFTPGPSKLKIAFINEKNPQSSAWIYGHELGRQHIEEVYGDDVSVTWLNDIEPEDCEERIEELIKAGNRVIFTTSPKYIQESLKAAIAHPEVKILNCSLNLPHKYIRTYYCRMYEAKFITGVIAGAMAGDDKIGYIADYPIYGMIANINAFALGAKMVNPRAKIYLEWSTIKGCDPVERLHENGVSYISNADMITPEEDKRQFGLHEADNDAQNVMAMPVWHWGKFYEKIIDSIKKGTFDSEESGKNAKALNYWWGMSAGVIDVICSTKLPIGTQRLVRLLKSTIKSGDFDPFEGVLYSQEGEVVSENEGFLTPEEIIQMDWLAENVIGRIPELEELNEEAQEVVLLQGVDKANGDDNN
ncbi:MAG: BMP family ABC transporter substrate-binding protein [Lachnospiraceae bacterium]|nr:BMP family ABC transporter substrate-binding protein [Lachnospiraceae bacterium]